MLVSFLIGAAGASQTAIVTLSNETITHNDGTTARAGIRFNTDGTVDKRRGDAYTQIDSATDWVTPNELGSSEFDVRFTGHSGDSFTTSAAAEDTWINLGSNREWNITEAGGSVKNTSVTFEIRRGGVTLDTGSYSFTADNT